MGTSMGMGILLLGMDGCGWVDGCAAPPPRVNADQPVMTESNQTPEKSNPPPIEKARVGGKHKQMSKKDARKIRGVGSLYGRATHLAGAFPRGWGWDWN